MKTKTIAFVLLAAFFSCASIRPANSVEVSKIYAILNAKGGRTVMVTLPGKANHQLIDYVDEKMIFLDSSGKQVTEDELGRLAISGARYYLLE
jgi:hypothetical protein